MGKRIVACALMEKDFRIAGAVERAGHPDLGRDAGEAAGEKKAGAPIQADLAGILESGDVVIDFSAASAAAANASLCARRRKPLVIGTTGLSPAGTAAIEEAAQSIPLVFSPNMSVGVNLLFDLARQVAAALGEEYDVEIIEAHHRFKADAPSGTAKKLAEAVAEARGIDLEKNGVYGRKGLVGARPPGEIGIHAVRAGDIVGEHTVIFSTLGERVEIAHRAHSRDPLARGALRAARFVLSAAPGLYTMRDVLAKTTSQNK
jgi:4-hydroxy-tetrahydrodipicolinate reductase